MEELICVRMADYKVAKGSKKLITRDLGSCVAVALRDPDMEIGGLIHIMLPSSNGKVEEVLYPKYADTGIELVVTKMVHMGANKTRLVAKIAGAAHIIRNENVPIEEDISSKNLMAVCRKLKEMSIPIIAAEVEDFFPRTVIFEPASGIMQLKTVGREDRFL